MVPLLLLVIMPKKKAVCTMENMTYKPTRDWRIEQEVKFITLALRSFFLF